MQACGGTQARDSKRTTTAELFAGIEIGSLRMTRRMAGRGVFVVCLVLLASELAQAAESKVVLGDPSLTAGVPGEGPLTAEQITFFLDEAKPFQEFQKHPLK